MSTYTTKIGAAMIGAFTSPGGALDQVAADHVHSEEDAIAAGYDADTMVFDERALQVLKDLTEDDDGSITEAGTENGVYYPMKMWIGGTGYEVT